MNDRIRPDGIGMLAERIGVERSDIEQFMGANATAMLTSIDRFARGEIDVDGLAKVVGAPGADLEQHDVGDGFEMSAEECAQFIDQFIRDEMADPETRIYSDEMVRKFQEVSYHLHWHCANLDGK